MHLLPAASGDQTRGAITKKLESGAEGGNRTRTSFRTTDFKSRVDTIT